MSQIDILNFICTAVVLNKLQNESTYWKNNWGAIKVHRNLGAGFLESVYQAALAYELTQAGISFIKEKELPVK